MVSKYEVLTITEAALTVATRIKYEDSDESNTLLLLVERLENLLLDEVEAIQHLTRGANFAALEVCRTTSDKDRLMWLRRVVTKLNALRSCAEGYAEGRYGVAIRIN